MTPARLGPKRSSFRAGARVAYTARMGTSWASASLNRKPRRAATPHPPVTPFSRRCRWVAVTLAVLAGCGAPPEEPPPDLDAGPADADAGSEVLDAGVSVMADAGIGIDAGGAPDAGGGPDAGTPMPDAGTPDRVFRQYVSNMHDKVVAAGSSDCSQRNQALTEIKHACDDCHRDYR